MTPTALSKRYRNGAAFDKEWAQHGHAFAKLHLSRDDAKALWNCFQELDTDGKGHATYADFLDHYGGRGDRLALPMRFDVWLSVYRSADMRVVVVWVHWLLMLGCRVAEGLPSIWAHGAVPAVC